MSDYTQLKMRLWHDTFMKFADKYSGRVDTEWAANVANRMINEMENKFPEIKTPLDDDSQEA